jgi:hypothetical protein
LSLEADQEVVVVQEIMVEEVVLVVIENLVEQYQVVILYLH